MSMWQRIIVLSFLLFVLPSPPFSARWDSPASATVRWSQRTRGCLYIVIRCFWLATKPQGPTRSRLVGWGRSTGQHDRP
jgi:hypothetical protein